jgi:hypothetical protein
MLNDMLLSHAFRSEFVGEFDVKPVERISEIILGSPKKPDHIP